MPHVFISYVREDRTQIDRLCRDLQAAGVTVWLDRSSILPGQRWRAAIRKAIREGMFFIACFSQSYWGRETSYMNEELVLAIEELRRRPASRVWFVPVLLDTCAVPDREIGAGETLRDLQWVDLSTDWNQSVGVLLKLVAGTETMYWEPSQDRRSGQDRRRANPRARLRLGCWKAFHAATGMGKFEDITPLNLRVVDKIYFALVPEACRYDYLTQDGAECDPDKVLRKAIEKAAAKFGTTDFIVNGIGAIYVIETIAEDIFSSYTVRPIERRSKRTPSERP